MFTLYNLSKTCQKRLRHKDVLVLGSAPNPSFRLYNPSMPIISVNGSAALLNKLGLPSPAATVLDFSLLDPGITASNLSKYAIRKHKLLEGLDLGVLVLTQSNKNPGGHPEVLNANYSSVHTLYKNHCKAIVGSVARLPFLESSINGYISRGAFAVALAAWCGAKSITFEGFSLFKASDSVPYVNHFYNDVIPSSEVDWLGSSPSEAAWDVRVHSQSDCCLISALSIRGFNIQTSLKEFAPLIHNWGLNPPPHMTAHMNSK